jgi:hypothetical protein
VIDIDKGRRRMKLQRLGGYAAIASVFGVAAYIVLGSMGINMDLSEPAKFMAAVSAAPVSFYALCVIQIIRFTLWQIMFFALYECAQNKTPQLARTSLIAASAGTAGLITVAVLYFNTIRIVLQSRIPTQDAAAYRAVDAIGGGLIFTTAHFYGWAFLLMGFAIIRTRTFSVTLGWLFAVTGLFGLLGFIYLPLTAVFLLMICVVSIWVGIAMLRQNQLQPALEEMAVSAKQRGL